MIALSKHFPQQTAALLAGRYGKTVTFTLSSTTP